MKNTLSLLLLFITAGLFAQDIAGTWNGMLSFPGGQLRLAINITKTGTGYTATMDSPDQGATGIPVTAISFVNNILNFSIENAKIEYEGTYQSNAFKGTFRQSGMPIPLDLGRDAVQAAAKPARPQEPKQPYPYHTENVTFKNEKAGITLAGTLTLPKKEGNYPAVVLISGSGPQNRDEEVLDHKPFLVLADHLTRNGIAVLRYDDRGVGESTGNFASATTDDFASDAEAAFNYLKTRKEINKKKIGLAGHSEGGTIAPIIASRNEDMAFIVLMAGSTIPGDELLLLQNYMLGKASGMPEAELVKLGGINKKIYDVLKQENNPDAMKQRLNTIFETEMRPILVSKGIPQGQVKEYMEAQVVAMTSPWYVHFIRYNPGPALEKVRCPILAINGDKDQQVTSVANLAAVKRATEKSGNKKVTVKELPGLNHLFQESATGSPQEYGTIEQTFSPVALNEISAWILRQVK
ncbi:MAG: alpha/beta fold hydrolase [Flavobacterium sp.]|nr:MAG: alpha/beta fold hydrolase [Flavobacterium sp.]